MSRSRSEGAVLLCDVRETPLSVDEALAAVRHRDCGGIAVFLGVVREHDHGAHVQDLDYTAHPQAVATMRAICEAVAGRDLGVRLAAVHRTGSLEVGDLAVVVAAAAAHRGQAFDACREVIDALKERVPIWKHQHFSDGSEEWVGLP